MKTLTLTTKQLHLGNLILVNKEHGILKQPAGTLVPVAYQSDILLQRQAAALLENLMDQINGWQYIVPVSGWRSTQEQQQIWNDTLAENGLEFTQTYVALPGHSEHQTGLAIDLALKQENIDFICPDFPYDGICQAFRKMAPDYGFIERYPKGRENITGIGHEPWHFRYVGVPHAKIMTENNLVLEEYMDFIRNYEYGSKPYILSVNGREINVSYLPMTNANGTRLMIDDTLIYSISGNNVDGFIMTEWRHAHENKTERMWA